MNTYYKILVSAYGLSTFSEGILLPIYAIFVQKVGGDILDAASAVAVYFFIQGGTEIWLHKQNWSYKYRMHLMTGGWLVWLLGIGTYFIIESINTLLLAQILTGLGNAIANPAFDAEFAEKTDKNISEYEYSVFEGLQDISQGIAAVLGGIIATTYGFKTLIFLMIITATISFMLILNYSRIKNNYSAKSA
ncbi:MFS transporter [Candidatus Wolfebacteria bacterium]|nr:MFS transporter [Candidatus Wolfebacteria bacterium]